MRAYDLAKNQYLCTVIDLPQKQDVITRVQVFEYSP